VSGVAATAARDIRLERGRLRPALLARLLRAPPAALAELGEGNDVVELKLARQRALLINRPDLVERLFADVPDRRRAASFAEATATRLGGVSLPNIEGDAHATRRRAVEAVFDPERLGPLVAPVTEQIDELMSGWRDGTTVELVGAFERLQTRTLGRLTFGRSYDPDSPALHDYLAVSRELVGRFVNPLAPALWRLPLPLTRRFERTQRAFNGAVEELIAARRNGGDDHLLRRLLEPAPGGPGLAAVEARDESWSYFSQGVMVYALAWAFSLIGRHGDIEARLHAEADEIGGEPHASADELPVTLSVVRESLRLYPPGWLIIRRLLGEQVLAGRAFPEGTLLLLSPYVLQRDGRFWPRPASFEPDRWLGERAAEIPPYAFVTFGVGPRRCPARALAELVLALAVTRIASRWRLHTPAGEPAHAYLPFLRPKRSVVARLERRERRRS
jgi:cytochrome P450